MVDQLNGFASEVMRVAREVGTEGKLGGQAQVLGVAGTWADLTENVNSMAANLTGQVRNIAEVTTAVASGDLSKKITVDVKGEILELKDTINVMVDQLNSFASEVTRVAREVGTEGRLGGQAQVEGVGGTWKDLTENVNAMAGNLTGQVRNIAEVTTAVALGDLSKKITVDVKGEILELKNTINTMVDQLNSFASEVTRVAREVGTEGKLGGQAQVRGVAGTWKDLTDNVNLMADNLTGQVRNIADVTTAVAKGDLSKKITVDLKGEILELKNTINTMVDQLNGFASEVTRVAREVDTEGKVRRRFVGGDLMQLAGVAATVDDDAHHDWESNIHPEDRERASRIDSGSQTVTLHYRWTSNDGEVRHFFEQCVRVDDSGDGQERWAGTLLDVTTQKRLEEQLVQAGKMEAIGQLTGGVAHDFNNLLAAVLGGIHVLERRLTLGEREQLIVDQMRHAAEHGAELVRRMMAFARKQDLTPVSVDPSSLCVSVAGLVEHTLGGTTSIDWQCRQTQSNLFVDKSQLELALLNLILNPSARGPSARRPPDQRAFARSCWSTTTKRSAPWSANNCASMASMSSRRSTAPVRSALSTKAVNSIFC